MLYIYALLNSILCRNLAFSLCTVTALRNSMTTPHICKATRSIYFLCSKVVILQYRSKTGNETSLIANIINSLLIKKRS